MRIAIAGFQHETNTFVESPTRLSDFERADSWPELLRGRDVLGVTDGMNLPIAGFAKAALAEGLELLPILWCAAEPGGKVTDRAFDTIARLITDKLQGMTPLDGVYLDLHGAMVTESWDDGEGELLARIRQIIGPDLPLVASLDMHANISQQMVNYSDAMTIFRTYPHLDMAATGARAYRMIREIHANGRPAKSWRQGEYLIPLHIQYTEVAPAQTLYGTLKAFDGPGTRLVELAMGFTAADTADCGPSVLAYSSSQPDAEAMAGHVFAKLQAAETQFETALLTPEDAVETAQKATGAGPVVIADVQDNPGAGASADTTGLLRELVIQNTPLSILGLLHDPQLAAKAHARGPGAEFEAEIGGRGPGDTPYLANVRVHHLSDGQCRYTGEMYGGGIATLGPSTALQLIGTQIHVIVTSIRNQCLDLAQIRLFNLEPEQARIICVKSTAHFRADFEPIAQDVLLCAAPGQFPCELKDVNYTKLRSGVRILGG
ncbi:M81 family metallopeptidase [Ruegeria sp. HKCCE4150]|uniref:M81 family metallopeptidase n=1 Tax=Ruegeria sp. HKCCE4150 TaxID=2794828 RepID=UPI001AE4CE5C|nr:M81 family metallopeptidase [Ruegeria sp. HKCCE4150]